MGTVTSQEDTGTKSTSVPQEVKGKKPPKPPKPPVVNAKGGSLKGKNKNPKGTSNSDGKHTASEMEVTNEDFPSLTETEEGASGESVPWPSQSSKNEGQTNTPKKYSKSSESGVQSQFTKLTGSVKKISKIVFDKK